MKRKKIKLFIIFLIITTSSTLIFLRLEKKIETLNVFNSQSGKTKHLIVIDPGHGGFDPGAMSGNIKESTINLKIAIKLKEYFEMFGFIVILTRYTEDDLSENDRKAHELIIKKTNYFRE